MIPSDLLGSPEDLAMYDRFFTSGLYYMASQAKEVDSIIMEMYNPDFKVHKLGVQLALNYGVLKAKKVYLKCSLPNFLSARKTFGKVVHWYPLRSRKKTSCALDPYTLVSELCAREDVPLDKALRGYKLFYN
jgi:hypothetical protein